MKTKIISFSFLLFLITSQTKAQQWEFVGLDSLLIKQIHKSCDTLWIGIDSMIDPELSSNQLMAEIPGHKLILSLVMEQHMGYWFIL